MRIGVRELRQNASRYLELVKSGRSVEVTERGRLVAVLAPPGADRERRDRLIAAGMIIAGTGAGWPDPVEVDGRSNAEVLDLERAERL